MRPEDFQKQFSVSRETLEKLQAYHALLLKWQNAINLVSKNTLEDSWPRHFADSAQLAAHISPGVKTLADLGSGAGFPGLVLGIMRPDIEVHLIESDERKVQFLKTVSRETSIPVLVHAVRIERVAGLVSPDLVTARALASLDKLLDMCVDWAGKAPGLQMLFLKGKGAEEEINVSRESFDFRVESIPSQTDKDARILHISDLKPRT
jgi:16S rRNA (guanine527-N7)-methyltransferase